MDFEWGKRNEVYFGISWDGFYFGFNVNRWHFYIGLMNFLRH